MNEFAERPPSSGAASTSGEPLSGRAAASRDSIDQSLRELIRRFDSERTASRGAFAKEIASITSREVEAATERLRRESAGIVDAAGSESASSLDAIRSDLEQRIEMRLAEGSSGLEVRLDNAERVLAERVERSLTEAVARAEQTVREQTDQASEAASATLGEKFSSIIEQEMKSALERQSAAVAAASLHHRRALEKMVTDQRNATSGALEKSLAESLDRRLGEIQLVIDSQVRQRAESFERSLHGELKSVKQELVASNSESVVRIGARLAQVTETNQGELAGKYEQALSTHRAHLEQAADAQLRDRAEALRSTAAEHFSRLDTSISERLAAAEKQIGESSVSALTESRARFDDDLSRLRDELSVEHRRTLDVGTRTIAEQAEKVGTELAVRVEQDRTELGSRIETRICEAREELGRSNAEAIAAAEQRTLVDGGAAVNKLVVEAISGAEARLDGRFDAIRSELTNEVGSARAELSSEIGSIRSDLISRVQSLSSELTQSAERATADLTQRIDSQVEARISEARGQLEVSALESAKAGREQIEQGLTLQVAEQVTLRSQQLRESLKAETESLLGGQTARLQQEAEARAREGEQRATVAAAEAARAELAAKVDGQLQRLTQGNEVKLDDHEKRIGALLSQAEGQIDAAREQIVRTSTGLERRARRHEHKLVKAESSTRIQKALQAVEIKAAAVEADAARASERLEASKYQRQDSEERISQALGKIDSDSGELGLRAEQALAQLEVAIGEVEGSRFRVLEVERRVGEAEIQVRKVGELKDQASAVELRIRRATEAETDAAAKILEAERRLTSLVE